jgi:hypothetical protein
MPEEFTHDVFLSHSTKDKAIVRPLAERLRADGLRVWFDEWEIRAGHSIPSRIEEGLEQSRVLVLCMSANAFGSDWTQLEAGTFRFRDPLNKERRFIPLRLDEAPIKGSLAQFLYINWLTANREQEYTKLLDACRPPAKPTAVEASSVNEQVAERVAQLVCKGSFYGYAFSPDRKRVLTAGSDNKLRLWETEKERCVRVFYGHTDAVWCLAWSADQRRALSGGNDNVVRLWDVETGQCLRVFRGHTGQVQSVAFSTDQRRALSGSSDETLRLWNIDTGQSHRAIEGKRVGGHFALSPDERRLLCIDVDRRVFSMWDVRTWSAVRSFEGHTDIIWCFAWSPDGSRVLSGGDDKTLRLWDVATGRCLRVLEGHTSQVLSLAWSPVGNYALSGASDIYPRISNST